jgi:hypothetical protein
VAPTDVERTEDGRWIVVDGRRWRATDPSIPEPLRQELVNELMAARRTRHRARTQDAKVALGERGPRWWDPPTEDGDRVRLTAAIRALTRHRGPDKTICPSDAARAVGGDRWRPLVPVAREVARELAAEGAIHVVQKGAPIDPAGPWRGPVRLRLARTD